MPKVMTILGGLLIAAPAWGEVSAVSSKSDVKGNFNALGHAGHACEKGGCIALPGEKPLFAESRMTLAKAQPEIREGSIRSEYLRVSLAKAEKSNPLRLVPMRTEVSVPAYETSPLAMGGFSKQVFSQAESIASGVLFLGGVGVMTGALLEAQRAEAALGQTGCTGNAECWRIHGKHAQIADRLGYTSAGLFLGAVGAGVPALLDWGKPQKSPRKMSFTLVPTLGGIRMQGTW